MLGLDTQLEGSASAEQPRQQDGIGGDQIDHPGKDATSGAILAAAPPGFVLHKACTSQRP